MLFFTFSSGDFITKLQVPIQNGGSFPYISLSLHSPYIALTRVRSWVVPGKVGDFMNADPAVLWLPIADIVEFSRRTPAARNSSAYLSLVAQAF